MKKQIYNSLIAFFGGLFGVSVLFIIWQLISDIGYSSNPFPATLLGRFLYVFFLASILEEGIKFLLIKRNIGQFPYGFLMGFGFGIGESMLNYPYADFGTAFSIRFCPITLHIITAGIICYFVKKNKPVLGLFFAIILHTLYDLLALSNS